MTKLEALVISKLRWFYPKNNDCEELFNTLEEIPEEERLTKNSKTLKLENHGNTVTYDSPYEKKVLEDLDQCSFIKQIKTQSLIIPFKAKIGNKIHKYYPDIQLLTDNNEMIIVEVKSYKGMVTKKNIHKQEVLNDYCKEHKYGYAIVDKNWYSFEDLKNEIVSDEIIKKFIEFVDEKGKVTFSECKEFKKKNKISDKKICFIIWKKRKKNLKCHKVKKIYTIFSKKKKKRT